MIRVLIIAGLLGKRNAMVRTFILFSNTTLGVDHSFIDLIKIYCISNYGISLTSKTTLFRLASVTTSKGLRIYKWRIKVRTSSLEWIILQNCIVWIIC